MKGLILLAILPFKVLGYSEKSLLSLKDAIPASLSAYTQLTYANVKVIDYTKVRKVALRYNSPEAIANSLKARYLLLGKIDLKYKKIAITMQLVDTRTQTRYTGYVEFKYFLPRIYNESTLLAAKLLKRVFPTRKTKYLYKPRDLDIVIAYNSSRKLKSLLEVLRDNIYDIIESFKISNPAPNVRVGVVDGNVAETGKPGILQLTSDPDRVSTFIGQSIIKANHSSIRLHPFRLLKYALNNIKWRISNHRFRILFLILTEDHEIPEEFIDIEKIIKTARLLGIRVYPLLTFNKDKEIRQLAQITAAATNGEMVPLTYKLKLNTPQGYKHILIKDRYVFLMKVPAKKRAWLLPIYLNDKNAINLSLSERITNMKDLFNLLLERNISTDGKIYDEDVNVDYTITRLVVKLLKKDQINKRYKKLVLRSIAGFKMTLPITTPANLKIYNKLKVGEYILVGAQIIPTTNYIISFNHMGFEIPLDINFFLNSNTAIILRSKDFKLIPKYLKKLISEVKINPELYNRYGFFIPPRWFFKFKVLAKK